MRANRRSAPILRRGAACGLAMFVASELVYCSRGGLIPILYCDDGDYSCWGNDGGADGSGMDASELREGSTVADVEAGTDADSDALDAVADAPVD